MYKTLTCKGYFQISGKARRTGCVFSFCGCRPWAQEDAGGRVRRGSTSSVRSALCVTPPQLQTEHTLLVVLLILSCFVILEVCDVSTRWIKCRNVGFFQYMDLIFHLIPIWFPKWWHNSIQKLGLLIWLGVYSEDIYLPTGRLHRMYCLPAWHISSPSGPAQSVSGWTTWLGESGLRCTSDPAHRLSQSHCAGHFQLTWRSWDSHLCGFVCTTHEEPVCVRTEELLRKVPPEGKRTQAGARWQELVTWMEVVMHLICWLSVESVLGQRLGNCLIPQQKKNAN